jgi:polysaccharide chain length determinant protein (PEP-CTERM system associated)
MNPMLDQALEALRGTWRRRYLGLGVAWAIGLGGSAAVIVMPDQYEATARLYVDTQSVLKPLMSGLAVQPNVEQQVRMLSRTLLSRPNVEKLIRMADLDLNVTSPDARDALIDRLINDIEVKPAGSDNLYSLRYRDPDPPRAKRVVDSLLSIFVEAGLGGKRRDTEKAQQFLDQQIQEYENKLQDAERRLKEFKIKNMNALGGSDTLTSMVAIDEQLTQARLELQVAVESRDALKRELRGEEPVFLPDPMLGGSTPGAPVVAVPELDTRIDALRKNLDDLLRTYTDQHPDVVGTRRVLRDLEKQREEKIEAMRASITSAPEGEPRRASIDRNPVYQQLKLNLADAEAQVASARARVQALESRYAQIRDTARLRPELEEELVQLNRDYDVNKKNYESLLARRESAQLTSELEQTSAVADFRIIDPPRVTPKPVAPNRMLLMTGVLVGSLAAGIFSSFAYSQVMPTFHTVRSLRRSSQRPSLGSIGLQPTGPVKRRRRLGNFVFFGGLAGLVAMLGTAFAILMLMARAA